MPHLYLPRWLSLKGRRQRRQELSWSKASSKSSASPVQISYPLCSVQAALSPAVSERFPDSPDSYTASSLFPTSPTCHSPATDVSSASFTPSEPSHAEKEALPDCPRCPPAYEPLSTSRNVLNNTFARHPAERVECLSEKSSPAASCGAADSEVHEHKQPLARTSIESERSYKLLLASQPGDCRQSLERALSCTESTTALSIPRDQGHIDIYLLKVDVRPGEHDQVESESVDGYPRVREYIDIQKRCAQFINPLQRRSPQIFLSTDRPISRAPRRLALQCVSAPQPRQISQRPALLAAEKLRLAQAEMPEESVEADSKPASGPKHNPLAVAPTLRGPAGPLPVELPAAELPSRAIMGQEPHSTLSSPQVGISELEAPTLTALENPCAPHISISLTTNDGPRNNAVRGHLPAELADQPVRGRTQSPSLLAPQSRPVRARSLSERRLLAPLSVNTEVPSSRDRSRDRSNERSRDRRSPLLDSIEGSTSRRNSARSSKSSSPTDSPFSSLSAETVSPDSSCSDYSVSSASRAAVTVLQSAEECWVFPGCTAEDLLSRLEALRPGTVHGPYERPPGGTRGTRGAPAPIRPVTGTTPAGISKRSGRAGTHGRTGSKASNPGILTGYRLKKTGVQRFACPFSKHKPGRYTNVHNACTLPEGFEWKYVIEHITRKHSASLKCIYCKQPWTTSDWESELHAHLDRGCPKASQIDCEPEFMTAAQEAVYRNNASDETDDVIRWALLYMRLFPEWTSIPSPFYDYLVPRHLTITTQSPPLIPEASLGLEPQARLRNWNVFSRNVESGSAGSTFPSSATGMDYNSQDYNLNQHTYDGDTGYGQSFQPLTPSTPTPTSASASFGAQNMWTNFPGQGMQYGAAALVQGDSSFYDTGNTYLPAVGADGIQEHVQNWARQNPFPTNMNAQNSFYPQQNFGPMQ